MCVEREKEDLQQIRCPLCGKMLMKAAACRHVEITCSRCRHRLAIEAEGGRLSVRETGRQI